MNTKEIYNLYQQSYCVVIDTRKVKPKCLFFGFKGEKVNGNAFAQQAINNGALAAFVEDRDFEDTAQNIFYVESSLESLQDLAKYHRAQLSIPFISVTGSNGKTTTKELMAYALQGKYKVLYTEGNYNNHLGVPLTILRIDPSYEIAIIEMGANHQGEIKDLCEIAQPNIGYITNFGKAHLEGFGGIDGVIKGKSEMYNYLMQHEQKILVNQADDIQQEKTHNYSHTITFGKTKSDFYFELLKSENQYLKLSYKDVVIETQLTGDYNFANASAAISLGLNFEVPIETIKTELESYTPENQRSQVIQKGKRKIILDAYNANPSSMKAALVNFVQFDGSKTVILGDMFELGEYSDPEHKNLVELVQNSAIDEAIFIGENFYPHKIDGFQFFKTKEDFQDYLSQKSIESDNILIKASRGIALETVVDKI